MRFDTDGQRLIARAARRCDRHRERFALIQSDARKRCDVAQLTAAQLVYRDYSDALYLLINLLPERMRTFVLW